MTFKVRFTEEALADLERLYEFVVAREDGDWATAERALAAIRNGLALLASSPFSCRKAAPDNTFLRELIIAFGASGYVALFEIDGAKAVTVLAVRHQREDDYH
jgi:plasmid stabilization system protein ParE